MQKLFFALAWLALPALVQAQDAYSTNADGSIYTYSTNADGSANIVAYAGPPWVVTIPTNINGLTVTSIGEGAFADDSLTSVTIPGSVTSIGEGAFFFCESLTSVAIPNSVTSIGENAFYECESLTSVTIGNGVISIGDEAFLDCTSLTSINVNASNQAYGSTNGVLFDKAQATLLQFPGGLGGSYTIPNGVTSIGSDAFEFSSLTSVTIPDSVTIIGDFAFGTCTRLTSVTIPNSVTSIGKSAFGGCENMTYVTIGNGVTSIGELAFVECGSLTNVTIPNSVTSIGVEAFADSPSLKSVTIGNGVTSIGDSAFDLCGSLTSVTIGNSVTSIGSYAFYTTSLTGVYFQGNSPSPNNDGSVFSGDPNADPATVYYLPGTTGWGAFFDGLPTALWYLPNPQILNFEPGFGVQPGGFGFTISWATNASVVVEAATNLANPVWLPMSTSPLTSGTSYFSDPQWTNYPARFYRVTSAFTVGGTLTGLPAGDTVTLQDNGSDNLTLSNNGAFTFPTALPNGHAYSVTISGTGGETSIQTEIDWPPVTANGSGTISGANVTNVVVQCMPLITGDRDLDMYNAAVADGTAHGGVPGVMPTENGGPFRVTALGNNSVDVAYYYSSWAVFTTVVGSTSCSATSFPSGTQVIQFGSSLVCGGDPVFGY